MSTPTINRLLKNYCGGPSATLRGARFLAYLLDMSRSLCAVRLASGHPRNVFQRPVKAFFIPILTGWLLALPAWAGNDVIVDKVWLRESVPGQTAATVQLNLSVNRAARLLGVSSPVADKGEIVRVERRNGRMQTHALPDLKLAAHSTTVFGMRGLYLMLRGLKKPLQTGDKVPVSLDLLIAGRRQTVNVTAEVHALELSYKHYNDPAVMDHR